jgi:uncharacterized protein
MTKHTIVGLACILTLLVGERAASPQSTAGPAGHWEGKIDVLGPALNIEVDLAPKGEKWEGTITIPSQNLKGFPLSAVAVEGSSVSFALKGVPGDPQFKGTLSKDGKSIAGDFSQAGAAVPFSLAWKGEARIEAPPKSTLITKDFEGSWEGTLDVKGTALRLILKLSNQDGVATGTLVSVDQGGVEIPIASIVQTGPRLKLVVSAIGASYEGDFKDGQIAGTWTQGAVSLPLVFKRTPK